MYKKITVIAVFAVVMILAVTPVGAITYGEPDGDGHPNVGLIVADRNGDGKLSLQCSGTLISPTVFLTAGHCIGLFFQLGVTKIWVTFDSEFDPQASELIPIADFARHPDYNPNTLSDDVGVVILAKAILNATPAMLPTENMLSQMKEENTLKGQTFVNVGYGATVDFKGNSPTLTHDGQRRVSTSPYLNLTPNNLGLLENHDATGEGGGCFGDSGGPHFLGDSNLIVSVTSWGDAVCRSLGMTQRLDIPSVRDFLGIYVTLP